jgi:hypothetical protein
MSDPIPSGPIRASKGRVRELLKQAWDPQPEGLLSAEQVAENCLKMVFGVEKLRFKSPAWEKLKKSSRRLRFAIAARGAR